MRLHPFCALCPVPEMAARVAAPPYDVVTREEAAAIAGDNPLSFLRVCRAEIDLPAADPYEERVYERARDNLARLVATRALAPEAAPVLYLYRLARQGREQVGVAGCVHVDEYEEGVIRRHEHTRPDKEEDRTRHVLATRAHAEPVLLAHRGRADVDALAAAGTRGVPLHDFTAADGVRHTLWRVEDPAPWVEAFAAVPLAYVADGHHRSASACRAARALQSRGAAPVEAEWFPAVLFPATQLTILPYNRLVADLAGQSPPEVLARLAAIGRLSPRAEPEPPRPGTFAIYLEGRWWLLEVPQASIDRRDPVRALDVSLLHEHVLGPVLGIGDPRTDKRIEFLGGGRGPRALEAKVNRGGAALAVSLYPTTVEQLMAVADAGQVMPPKSTWFEPKLASGLFVHTLD